MMKQIVLALAIAAAFTSCRTAAPAGGAASGAVDDQSFRQSAPAPLASTPWQFPRVDRARLDNGLRVLVAENHGAPLATIRLVVHSGAERDPHGRAGLATLTANLLDEGAGSRDGVQLAEAVGALGGNLTSTAGWDSSVIVMNVLSRNLDDAMGIVADLAMRAAISPADFERVRKERLNSILQQRDNAGAVATNRFSAWVYGDTPYGNELFGNRSSVEAIDRSAAVEFYRKNYVANNASLIVTGDVDPRRARELAAKHFSVWAQGEVRPTGTLTAPPLERSHVYIVDRPQAVQSEIRIGHAGVSRSSEDYFPLLVMNTILGGNFGSRLNLNLRERHGYTYGARSAFSYRRSAGPFTVSTPVRNEVTGDAVREILSELRRIRSGDLTVEELDNARNYQMGVFPAMVESAAALASRLEEMELYGLPQDYFATYRERIAAVSGEDVERVAREYLDPDRLAIVVVGKADDIREPLGELGVPISVHDIDGVPR